MPNVFKKIAEHQKKHRVKDDKIRTLEAKLAQMEREYRELYGLSYAANDLNPDARESAWVDAFVAGAKWWEWTKTGATMWQSDQEDAWTAAKEKFAALNPKV